MTILTVVLVVLGGILFASYKISTNEILSSKVVKALPNIVTNDIYEIVDSNNSQSENEGLLGIFIKLVLLAVSSIAFIFSIRHINNKMGVKGNGKN